MTRNKICLSLAIAFPLSYGVMAKITPEDTAQTSFDISGTIAAECKVNHTNLESSAALDLTTSTAQNASSVAVWCNTGQSSADTTYRSVNNGFLVDESGNRIAYSINVGEQANNLSLSSPQTVKQLSGSGVNGDSVASDIAIIPQVSGLENSGSYSDTIAVTVSYN